MEGMVVEEGFGERFGKRKARGMGKKIESGA
jgi:hypothetical protein